VQGFAAGTRQPEGVGDGLAGRVSLDYQPDRVGASLSHLFVGRDATADLGFVTRTGIHRIDYAATWAPRPRALGLRRVELGFYGNQVLDVDGRLLDRSIGPSFNPRWNNGSSIYVWAGFGATVLEEEFELSDQVLVPAGRYEMRQLGWFANTSSSRPVVLRSDGFLQWVYDGRVGAASAQVDLAPSSRLGLTLRWTHNRVDLPGGAFSAELASVRLTAAASPRLVANALVQYNELANTVDANFRIAYTFRPGSDLYLVINEQRGDDTRLWAAGDRAALFKVTWLSRF